MNVKTEIHLQGVPKKHSVEVHFNGTAIPTKIFRWAQKPIRWIVRCLGILLALMSIGGCKMAWGDTPGEAAPPAAQTAQAQVILRDLAAFSTQTAQANKPVSVTTLPVITLTTSPPSTSTPGPPTETNSAQPPETFSLGEATPLPFLAGGTSAYAQGWITANAPQVFTLRAMEGQTLILTVTSENQDVFLDVQGEDSSPLVWGSNALPFWFGTLPKTQTYQITLLTHNPGTSYFLAVEIPANINFDPGAYAARIEGHIEPHTDFQPAVITRVRYLVYAAAGQTMVVELSSPNLEALSMGMIGQSDGQPYLRYHVKNSGGTFGLPYTQGYYLDVYATGGQPADFTLEVTIR